jgi:hypothetical protein
MHRIGRCSLLGKAELGDLLRGSIARGVRRVLRETATAVNLTLMGLLWMVAEMGNDLIRINLRLNERTARLGAYRSRKGTYMFC